MSVKKTPKDKDNQPLREQIKQLDQLIEWFNQPDFDLDEALKKFDEGVVLTTAIQARLAEFENKITILKRRFDQVSDQAQE